MDIDLICACVYVCNFCFRSESRCWISIGVFFRTLRYTNGTVVDESRTFKRRMDILNGESGSRESSESI